MNNEHIIYTIRPYQLALLDQDDDYIEIWKGLPRGLLFGQGESNAIGGEMGLVHIFRKDYVWVTPTAAKLLAGNPDILVYASRIKRPEFRVERVTALSDVRLTFGATLDSAIVRAEEINHKSVEKAIKRGSEKRA